MNDILKRMKYFFIFSLHLFSLSFVFSQNIQGTITDELRNPIFAANIQLIKIDNNRTLQFTQSDEKGFFYLETKNSTLPLKLIITHISFEKKEIHVDSFEKLNIKLKEKVNVLKDIVLETKPNDIVEKNDTLIYNLNSLLVGTETNLKDYIERLPGLSIDNNGKIRYNGAKIDNLLINGDEIFRDNHQLATENLTAEMIEKIELLKNYQDLSSIKGFENSNNVALNVTLKDSFTEKNINNIDAEGCVKNRYKLQNNFFNFGSKRKINVLTNANNLNESVFSPIDFIELKKSTGKNMLKDKIMIGREVSTDNDLPSFVFAKDNVTDINSKNNTVNFTKRITKNKRIEFISILNKNTLNESILNYQTFFDGISSNLLNTYNSNNKSIFSSNFFKYENKIGDNSYLEGNAYVFYNDDNQFQDIDNLVINTQESTKFQNNTNNKTLRFGLNSVYKNKFTEKILFESVIFQDLNFSKINKNYLSNSSFSWFNVDNNAISQTTNYNSFSFGLKAKTSMLFDKNSLDIKFISTIDNESLRNNSFTEMYQIDNTFTLASNNFNLTYLSQPTNKFKYILTLDFINNHNIFATKFNNSINSVLPGLTFSYKFSKKLSSSIGYSSKLNNVNIYNFLTGNLIENYRSEIVSNELISEKMLMDNFNSNLFYVDISKNIFTTFSLSYNKNKRTLGNEIENTNFSTKQSYRYVDYGSTLNLISNISKKYKYFPFGFNFFSVYSLVNNQTITNNTLNINEIEQSDIDFEIKSYFKNKTNFTMGIKSITSNTKIKNPFVTTYSSLTTNSPYFNIEGSFLDKKIIWKFNSVYHFFNSTYNSSEDIFDLGFRLNYNPNNSLFNFYLHGTNILNIKNNNTKNTIYNNVYSVNETIMNTLSGFVNIGLKITL